MSEESKRVMVCLADSIAEVRARASREEDLILAYIRYLTDHDGPVGGDVDANLLSLAGWLSLKCSVLEDMQRISKRLAREMGAKRKKKNRPQMRL